MSLIERCRERCRNVEEDEGFTLIELLVVLLIIGILLAIAIPTFLSVTKGANGTAAQSNLQTALTGGDTYYTDANQSYSGLMNSSTYSTLSEVDTGLTYEGGTTNGSGVSKATNEIGWNIAADYNSVAFWAFAPGQNRCYAVADVKAVSSNPTGGTLPSTAVGTYYGFSTPATANQCSLSDVKAIGNWQSNGFPK
jgi:type IV pilus assembly protein PilA